MENKKEPSIKNLYNNNYHTLKGEFEKNGLNSNNNKTIINYKNSSLSPNTNQNIFNHNNSCENDVKKCKNNYDLKKEKNKIEENSLFLTKSKNIINDNKSIIGRKQNINNLADSDQDENYLFFETQYNLQNNEYKLSEGKIIENLHNTSKNNDKYKININEKIRKLNESDFKNNKIFDKINNNYKTFVNDVSFKNSFQKNPKDKKIDNHENLNDNGNNILENIEINNCSENNLRMKNIISESKENILNNKNEDSTIDIEKNINLITNPNSLLNNILCSFNFNNNISKSRNLKKNNEMFSQSKSKNFNSNFSSNKNTSSYQKSQILTQINNHNTGNINLTNISNCKYIDNSKLALHKTNYENSNSILREKNDIQTKNPKKNVIKGNSQGFNKINIYNTKINHSNFSNKIYNNDSITSKSKSKLMNQTNNTFINMNLNLNIKLDMDFKENIKTEEDLKTNKNENCNENKIGNQFKTKDHMVDSQYTIQRNLNNLNSVNQKLNQNKKLTNKDKFNNYNNHNNESNAKNIKNINLNQSSIIKTNNDLAFNIKNSYNKNVKKFTKYLNPNSFGGSINTNNSLGNIIERDRSIILKSINLLDSKNESKIGSIEKYNSGEKDFNNKFTRNVILDLKGNNSLKLGIDFSSEKFKNKNDSSSSNSKLIKIPLKNIMKNNSAQNNFCNKNNFKSSNTSQDKSNLKKGK